MYIDDSCNGSGYRCQGDLVTEYRWRSEGAREVSVHSNNRLEIIPELLAICFSFVNLFEAEYLDKLSILQTFLWCSIMWLTKGINVFLGIFHLKKYLSMCMFHRLHLSCYVFKLRNCFRITNTGNIMLKRDEKHFLRCVYRFC